MNFADILYAAEILVRYQLMRYCMNRLIDLLDNLSLTIYSVLAMFAGPVELQRSTSIKLNFVQQIRVYVSF